MLSGFFSACEAAYTGVNKIRLKNKVDDLPKGKEKSGKIALNLIDNYEKLLTTILICNNIVNILFSAISANLFASMFGAVGLGYAVFF
ncbi:MAG: CNNM domain-containing protein, partial [Bacilli bacterium]